MQLDNLKRTQNWDYLLTINKMTDKHLQISVTTSLLTNATHGNQLLLLQFIIYTNSHIHITRDKKKSTGFCLQPHQNQMDFDNVFTVKI